MPFDLQGHRGARGLRPENTLPSFEAALDAGVTSVETDLHLTRDGQVVLCHDPFVTPHLFSPAPPQALAVSGLTLAELRQYRGDRNPNPTCFPRQDPAPTPVAVLFARGRGFDPHAVVTLGDLFDFVAAYAGALGETVGKSARQRQRAARLRFDLELKRVPFFPEAIGDDFDGRSPAALERRTVEAIRAAGLCGRVTVRSFDHRAVRLVKQLEPALTGAVLVAGTAPADPVAVARAAGAEVYCPAFEFLDADLTARLKEGGVRVLPWTVNDAEQWRRLLAWGVDGITTDEPDRLAACLDEWGCRWD